MISTTQLCNLSQICEPILYSTHERFKKIRPSGISWSVLEGQNTLCEWCVNNEACIENTTYRFSTNENPPKNGARSIGADEGASGNLLFDLPGWGVPWQLSVRLRIWRATYDSLQNPVGTGTVFVQTCDLVQDLWLGARLAIQSAA